ncbi:MAG: DegQ family serine endoprotease [Alphaproteobacteria bacterium]|nr:DegQ family serine endoprotease [Alphaproteobacteria bacterium]
MAKAGLIGISTARCHSASRSGAVIAAALSAVLAWTPAASARAAPESFADLAAKLLPSVVNVSTSQQVKPGSQSQSERRRLPEMPQFPPGSPFEEFFREFFDRNRPDSSPRRTTSLGSGFIVDASGLVVTNNHVVADADEVTVILHDDTSLKAEIVGRDAKTDLALLRVKSSKPLPALKWGDSDTARVGDWVLAIGNPFGLGGSVTAGILSARQRDINSGPYDDFIQTDASINRGNSGGPLFNMAGEVIGVNTAIFSPSGGSIGIGFAIPSALAKPVIQQIKDYGRTRRGWLGVRIQGVTDEIAESLGLGRARGALVASTSDKGPAAEAGILAGDVVLTFDGRDITDMRRLPRVVAETPINKRAKVVVWRKGKEMAFDVKVGELDEREEAEQVAAVPRGDAKPTTAEALGLSLSSLSGELKQKFSIGDDVNGVVVTGVSANSPAAEKGVRAGDVILEVGQEEVKSPADVAAKVEEARRANRKSLLLLIDRQGDLRFVALRIDKG